LARFGAFCGFQGPPPCIDVTYLDGTLRIARGGDGSLFVLARCEPRGRLRPLRMPEASRAPAITSAQPYDAATDWLPTGGLAIETSSRKPL
jgi:hypothetical protein